MIRPPDPEDLKAFATRVVSLLESTGLPYAVCGSLAAMEYSEPRLSIDVDLMVTADSAQLAGIVAAVEEWGLYITPLEVIIEQLIPAGQPLNIIDGASGAKADIYPVTGQGLSGAAMNRRRQRVWDVQSGTSAWFLSPEDVILYKLMYYRMGEEISQKHPADVVKMIGVVGGDLDVPYIERWADQLGIRDLWDGLRWSGGSPPLGTP
ncbi:MAG: hypothetical protein IPJ58_00395 [Ardenticatenia bacterium]|nr:hypothetical protein [Ardenticatenia bacterium]